MAKQKMRAIRAPDVLWDAALAKAHRNRWALAELIRQWLTIYVEEEEDD